MSDEESSSSSEEEVTQKKEEKQEKKEKQEENSDREEEGAATKDETAKKTEPLIKTLSLSAEDAEKLQKTLTLESVSSQEKVEGTDAVKKRGSINDEAILLGALQAMQSLGEQEAAAKEFHLLAKEPGNSSADVCRSGLKVISAHLSEGSVLQNIFLILKLYKGEDQTPAILRENFREQSGYDQLSEALKKQKDVTVLKPILRFVGDLITKNKRSKDNVLNCEGLVSSGLVPVIVSLLSHQDEDVKGMAAGILRILATYEGRSAASFQSEIAAAGAIPLFVDLLKDQTNPTLLRQAASAIRNLTDGNSFNQKSFIEKGVLDVAMSALQQEIEVLRLSMLGVLNAVTLGNKDAKEVLRARADFLPTLDKMLKCETLDIQISALGLVKTLATDHAEFQSLFGSSGVLKQILKALTKPDTGDKLIKANADALSAILMNHAKNSSIARDTGIVSAFDTLLDTKVEVIRVSILAAMKAYAVKNTDAQESLVEGKLIERLISLISSTNASVVEQTVDTLAACAAHEKARALFSANTVDSLLNVMRNKVTPKTLQATLACISNVISEPAVEAAILKDPKSIAAIFAVFDGTSERSIVNAARCISKLATPKNKKLGDTVKKIKGHVGVVGMLSSPNIVIQEYGASTIGALVKCSPSLAESFGKAGAVQVLLKLPTSAKATDALKGNVAGALAELAVGQKSIKKAVYEGKGIQMLLEMIASKNERVQANAARALCACCESYDKNQAAAMTDLNRLVTLLHGKEGVAGSALGAIASICDGNAKAKEKFTTIEGAAEEVVRVIKAWGGSALLPKNQADSARLQAVQWGVLAVKALITKNEANKKLFLGAGAQDVLTPLRNTETNPALKKEVEKTLSLLGVKPLSAAKVKDAPSPAKIKPGKEEKETQKDKQKEQAEENEKDKTKESKKENAIKQKDDKTDEKNTVEMDEKQEKKEEKTEKKAKEEESDEESDEDAGGKEKKKQKEEEESSEESSSEENSGSDE